MTHMEDLRGPANRDRVNVKEDAEIRWYCQKFDCTPLDLKKAVNVVGVKTKDVEAYLKAKK